MSYGISDNMNEYVYIYIYIICVYESRHICQIEVNTWARNKSDRICDKLLDRMRCKISDRMSEYMSDRMPDSMPDQIMSEKIRTYFRYVQTNDINVQM